MDSRRPQTMRAQTDGRLGLVRLAALMVIVTIAALGVIACGEQQTSAGGESLTQRGPIGGSYRGGTATGDTERGAEFARWVLDQDPNRQYYTDVVVRGEQSLGIKVQPDVTRRELEQLLVSLTEGMARTFPNRDLEVIAFYQSGDKLAEADYNSRSGNVEVAFTQ